MSAQPIPPMAEELASLIFSTDELARWLERNGPSAWAFADWTELRTEVAIPATSLQRTLRVGASLDRNVRLSAGLLVARDEVFAQAPADRVPLDLFRSWRLPPQALMVEGGFSGSLGFKLRWNTAAINWNTAAINWADIVAGELLGILLSVGVAALPVSFPGTPAVSAPLPPVTSMSVSQCFEAVPGTSAEVEFVQRPDGTAVCRAVIK